MSSKICANSFVNPIKKLTYELGSILSRSTIFKVNQIHSRFFTSDMSPSSHIFPSSKMAPYHHQYDSLIQKNGNSKKLGMEPFSTSAENPQDILDRFLRNAVRDSADSYTDKFIEYYLEHGANVNKIVDGETVKDMANKAKNERIVAKLDLYGAKTSLEIKEENSRAKIYKIFNELR